MRSLIVASFFLVSVFSGCFSPDYGNGTLQCAIGAAQCPRDYTCVTGHCYKIGMEPLVSVDMMAPIMVISNPPKAIWISSGGGSAASMGTKNQLNLSIGGTWVSGSATGPALGRKLTFGYFPADSIKK